MKFRYLAFVLIAQAMMSGFFSLKMAKVLRHQLSHGLTTGPRELPTTLSRLSGGQVQTLLATCPTWLGRQVLRTEKSLYRLTSRFFVSVMPQGILSR